MSAKGSKPAAHLLQALALRMKCKESAPLLIEHVKGKTNDMADVASQAFLSNHTHEFPSSHTLSFLHYFNSKFPLPQNQIWREFHLTMNLTTRVISELEGMTLSMESWMQLPKKGGNIGTIGENTPNTSTSTPCYPTNTYQITP